MAFVDDIISRYSYQGEVCLPYREQLIKELEIPDIAPDILGELGESVPESDYPADEFGYLLDPVTQERVNYGSPNSEWLNEDDNQTYCCDNDGFVYRKSLYVSDSSSDPTDTDASIDEGESIISDLADQIIQSTEQS